MNQPIETRFLEWCKKHRPWWEYGSITKSVHIRGSGITGLNLDFLDDIESGSMRAVIEQELEGKGVGKHIYWKRSTGAWVYEGARGEGKSLMGAGPTKIAAICEALMESEP